MMQRDSTSVGLDIPPMSTGVSGLVSYLCAAIVKRDIHWVNRILDAVPLLACTPHVAGVYPLDVAVLTGDVTLVKLILGQPNVSPNAATLSRIQYPSIATKMSMLVIEFCSAGWFDVIPGASALHYACRVGSADVVRLLAAHSSSFSSVDAMGMTPVLHFDTSRAGSIESMFIYKAAERKFLRTQAIFEGTISAAAGFLKTMDLESFDAVLNAHPFLAKEVLEDSTQGWTLLHLAATYDNLECVKLLLEKYDAPVNATDDWSEDDTKLLQSTSPWQRRSFWFTRPLYNSVNGCTALHYACLEGNMEIIDALLKAGADWTIADSRGRLPEKYVEDVFGMEMMVQFRLLCNTEDARRRGQHFHLNEESPDPPKDRKRLSYISSPSVKHRGVAKKEGLQKSLEEILSQKIVGQQGPVRTVASAIRLRENGWTETNRPLVMLFLGSSGIGKTELAKQVALYINRKSGVEAAGKELKDLETKSKFVRLDMSEFQEPHSVANYTGSPKGYVGYNDGGGLTSHLKRNPNAIVLLDEIEKAHPDVLTVFLQIFDEGRITHKKDGTVYCSGATFIMTSNLGADEIKAASPFLRKVIEDTADRPEAYDRMISKFVRQLHPVMKASLKRDEFLGRVNQTVVFLPLNDEEAS